MFPLLWTLLYLKWKVDFKTFRKRTKSVRFPETELNLCYNLNSDDCSIIDWCGTLSAVFSCTETHFSPPVFVHKDTLRPHVDSEQAVEIARSPVKVYPRSVISEATDTNFLPSQASSSFFVSRFSLGSCDQLKQFAVTGSRVHNTIY